MLFARIQLPARRWAIELTGLAPQARGKVPCKAAPSRFPPLEPATLDHTPRPSRGVGHQLRPVRGTPRGVWTSAVTGWSGVARINGGVHLYRSDLFPPHAKWIPAVEEATLDRTPRPSRGAGHQLRPVRGTPKGVWTSASTGWSGVARINGRVHLCKSDLFPLTPSRFPAVEEATLDRPRRPSRGAGDTPKPVRGTPRVVWTGAGTGWSGASRINGEYFLPRNLDICVHTPILPNRAIKKMDAIKECHRLAEGIPVVPQYYRGGSSRYLAAWGVARPNPTEIGF